MIFNAGIVGTKEYRKPEWVTHMEELQEALQGNKKIKDSSCMVHDNSSIDLSMDSLEASATSLNLGNKISKSFSSPFETEAEEQMPFYINQPESNNFCLSEGLSTASINSEPPLKSKNKVAFVQSAMDKYLNSHRHSLSSVMELIGIAERNIDESENSIKTESIEMKVDEVLEQQDLADLVYFSEEEEEFIDDQPRRYSYNDNSTCYYTLSPIEENSEPSTGSSTLRDTISKDSRLAQYYSCSYDPIPSEPFYLAEEKYQTFPRSKQPQTNGKSQNLSKDYYNETTMYPLEPRELDPSAFNQLHTVDSQEELQEFLLLESECKSDQRDKGLASAFLESDEDDTEISEDTLTLEKTGNFDFTLEWLMVMVETKLKCIMNKKKKIQFFLQ